jgi:hypothetical protein
MKEGKAEEAKKVSWSSIFSTVAGGLILAGTTYFAALFAPYVFSNRLDLYLIDRPLAPDGSFQKLVVVENFSSSSIAELQFTIAGENLQISAPVNFEKSDLQTLGPASTLVSLTGVLPTRVASFVLSSKFLLSENSFRPIKVPFGYRYVSKDRLVESLFDWSQLVNAIIQFVIFVSISFYFDRLLARKLGELESIRRDLDRTSKDIEELRKAYQKIKLLYMKRALNLAKENRLWREAAVDAFENLVENHDLAKKLLFILLRKAGVRPEGTLDDAAGDDLIEKIEDAQLSPIRS